MIFKAVAGSVSAIALMAMLSAGVMAQTADSTSGATSSSGAVSGSSSNSGAAAISRGGNARNTSTQSQGVSSQTNTGVTLNQTSNSSPNTTANNTDRITGGTNNQNYNQQGGYTSSDNIVRAAPTVYAPPVSGGSPCSLGYSAGASFLGWGAAAGGQVVDAECERRMHVAMLYNAGWKGASKELACNNKEVYMAFRTAGEPCSPRPQWEGGQPAPQPMVQQQPQVIVPVSAPPPAPMAAKDYPRCRPPTIVDNCRS